MPNPAQQDDVWGMPQVIREINALKELVFTRLDGMDRAIVLFDTNITRVPTSVDKQVEHLKELMLERFKVDNERFNSVQTQFVERDTRTDQTSRDSKVAVDAALQAAKEAVGEQNKSSALAIAKSESSTTKQIDQIGAMIQSTVVGINGSIGDLKDRITRIEGTTTGEKENKITSRGETMNIVSIVGLLVGAVVGIGGIVLNLLK